MIKQKSAVDKLLADQEIKRYKELLERKLSEPDPYPDNDWQEVMVWLTTTENVSNCLN